MMPTKSHRLVHGNRREEMKSPRTKCKVPLMLLLLLLAQRMSGEQLMEKKVSRVLEGGKVGGRRGWSFFCKRKSSRRR